MKDYHSAYEAGNVTPTVVAQALLDLILKNPKHKDAFLEIKEDRVMAAAEASTRRYKVGKALGWFDGVPVGVKGKSLSFRFDKRHFSCVFAMGLSSLYNPLDVSVLHSSRVVVDQVTDEVDLQGYSRCLGSCKDFTSTAGNVTSWCVQKWEEAGAIILGKLNMHELGLGMHKTFEGFDLLSLVEDRFC